jgi:hypothetical protein
LDELFPNGLLNEDRSGPLPVYSSLPRQKFSGRSHSSEEKQKITDALREAVKSYDTLPKPVHLGKKLETSAAQAKDLLVDTDRFVREFHAAAVRWRADSSQALRVYRTTDAGWYQVSRLVSSVPDSMNGLVRHSRLYLEAVYREAYRAAEYRVGKRAVRVIVLDNGPWAVSFRSLGTPQQCAQFAHSIAQIGHYFAERIGEDPTPWVARQAEVEALAKEYHVSLHGNK